MKKQNEMALDAFADILIPLSEILSDKNIGAVYKEKGFVAAASEVIKTHKNEVIEILAIMDGVPVEEYEVSLMSLPVKVLKLLNDDEVQRAFSGQGQKNG